MRRRVPVVVFATLALLATAGAPARARAQVYTYQGTVHAVDPKAGTLELIIGVGEALRLVRLRTVPATIFLPPTLPPLKPGDVVRADCRRTDAGLVADRIVKPDTQ